MTHPTKAIYGTLLKDFVKLGNVRATEDQLFSDEDLRNSLPRIEVIDFHQTVEIKGIKVATAESPCREKHCILVYLSLKMHKPCSQS